jgi:hypothetical protein
MTMLHLLMGKEPWFAPKRYGYGAGLPLCWQGWALLASYLGLVAGIAQLWLRPERMSGVAAWLLLAFATLGFAVIAQRRTRGGWRWRWGEAA